MITIRATSSVGMMFALMLALSLSIAGLTWTSQILLQSNMLVGALMETA